MMRKIDKKILFCFLIMLTSFYVLINGGHYGGDAINNYMATRSIVLNRSILFDESRPDIPEIKWDSSVRFSPYGLGMAILQIPLFLLGLLLSKLCQSIPQDQFTFFFVSFTNTFLSVLNSVLLVFIMLRNGFTFRRAVILSMVYSFSTMAAVYSKAGFPEPALATCLLLAVLSVFSYAEKRNKYFLIAAGASLGCMCLVKIYSVILVPVFLCYLFATEWKNRSRLLYLMLPFALIFSLEIWSNYVRVGSVVKSAYGDAFNEGFRYGRHFFKGIFYYWFSSGKGFFFYNIPLVLSLFFWRGLFKKYPARFLMILSIIAIHVIYFAYFFKRGSLFSWGPRYLFLIIPLAIIFLGDVFNNRRSVVILALASITGFLVQLPALVMNYSKYLYFVKERLRLEEFLINFIPDLSPIGGIWQLFLSFIWRTIFSAQRSFIFSPDPVFVPAVSAGFEQYDMADIWLVNVMRFKPDLSLSVCIFWIIILICFIWSLGLLLWFLIRQEEYPGEISSGLISKNRRM